ncbi:MAG: hypothetical protein VB049_02255 [Candidatus Pelethousia sp.]|nr:hypothetical protein [Candidatus Pelethousia sp.]
MGKRVLSVGCIVVNPPDGPNAYGALRVRIWTAYYMAVERHINDLPWDYGTKRALADLLEQQRKG